MNPNLTIKTNEIFYDEEYLKKLLQHDVTDDRIFGFMTRLNIDSYFDPAQLDSAKNKIANLENGLILVIGIGAAYVSHQNDLLIYADMARWEIQQRMRKHLVNNIGMKNKNVDDWMLLYKQGFFVDWRICDKLKKKLMHKWDFVLDTNNNEIPKMIDGKTILKGFEKALTQPFSVVPFYYPGPWAMVST